MAALWVAMAVLSIGAVALLLVPMARPRRVSGSMRAEYDIRVFKDQLKEVDDDLERGQLDEKKAEAARTEIQRRMLAAASSKNSVAPQESAPVSNKAVMAAVAVLVPLGAFITYFSLGAPGLKDLPLAGRAGETAGAVSRQDRDMVAKLAERLKQNPNNLQGWILLGNSFMTMRQYADAAKAYAKALEIDDARLDITLNYAEALTFSTDAAIPGKAISIFKKIRKAEPYEPKSRYYIGLYKADMGDIKGAMQEWVDLMAIGDEDAPWREIVQSQIGHAAKKLKVDPDSVKPSAEAQKLAKAKPTAEAHPKGVSRKEMEALAKMTPEQREAMFRDIVKSLAAEMEKNPGDADGWRRLAQGYLAIGEKEKAKQALARAEALRK